MGKRRDDSSSEEDIRRKIRKLEKKLQKRNRKRIIYSSSDEESDDTSMWAERDMPVTQPSTSSVEVCTEEAIEGEKTLSPTPDQEMDHYQSSPVQCPDTLPSTQEPCPDDDVLAEDILALLGDAPQIDTSLGANIHKDIASRWTEILMKGLTKEVKDKLLKEYLIPGNCDSLLAPTLNPEVKAALPEALVKRDVSLMYKQKEIGIALSALASVTEMSIHNETSKQKMLNPISDACRILCNRHFTETRVRRDFVISAINNELKETLISTTRDSYLFGKDLGEKLRNAKSIQKTGETLKNATQKTMNKPNFMQKPKYDHLNYKRLHRKTDNKMAAGQPERYTRLSQRFPGPPRHAAARLPERPPPRPTRRK